MSKNRRKQIKAIVDTHIDFMIGKIKDLGIPIVGSALKDLKDNLVDIATRYDQEIEQFDLDSIDITETIRAIDKLSFLTLVILTYVGSSEIFDTVMEDPGDFQRVVKELPSYYEIKEDERRFEQIMESLNIDD